MLRRGHAISSILHPPHELLLQELKKATMAFNVMLKHRTPGKDCKLRGQQPVVDHLCRLCPQDPLYTKGDGKEGNTDNAPVNLDCVGIAHVHSRQGLS